MDVLMDTESESIDISSIKLAALRPLEPIAPSSLQQDLSSNTHSKGIQNGFDTSTSSMRRGGEGTSSPSAQPAQHVIELDSLALASTVPDSQGLAHTDLLLQSLPEPRKTSIVQALQNMSSEAASPHDTQPLSQSVYDGIITKTRNSIQLGRDGYTAVGVDITQGTLNEGDEGHVDLLSNYRPIDEADEELEFQDHEFSPTQPQTQLPLFPESQRFKTPATTSKKRDYNGDFVETPLLPHNPLARNGPPTPGRMMGLSQAFAATQATSSPLVNFLPNLLPSDLPSPNIELQPRPATVSSSSPLLEHHRAGNEPLVRYIPVKESQADRERRAKSLDPDAQGDVSEDDFDVVPSLIVRQRRQRERERAAQLQLQAASSPNRPRSSRAKPSAASSSPPKPVYSSAKASTYGYGRRTRQQLLPRLTKDETTSPTEKTSPHESEEETDHEIEVEIAVRRSSQAPLVGEEDKENTPYEPFRVPETSARLQQAIGSMVGEQSSPSTRHGSGALPANLEQTETPKEERFAVADSQPSQSRRGPLFNQATKLISSGEGTEFVPQSQPALASSTVQRPDSPRQHHSTIPETSSTQLKRNLPTEGSISTPSSVSSQKVPNSRHSQTPFETAPSHMSSSTRGARRKKMAEILAQASPERSNSGLVREMLADIQDSDINDFLGSQSPIRPGRHSKRIHLDSNVTGSESLPRPNILSAHIDTLEELRTNSSAQEQDRESSPELAMSATEIQRMAETNEARVLLSPKQRPNPQTLGSKPGIKPKKANTSVWDIQTTPPAKKSVHSRANIQRPTPRGTIRMSGDKRKARVQGSSEQRPVTPELRPDDEQVRDSSSSAVPSISGSTVNSKEVIAPNQVWACFNGKTRAYYPARCVGVSGSDKLKYQVQWEGYDPEEIDGYGVRRLDLRIGDVVKVNLSGFPRYSHIVRGFKDKIEPAECETCLTDSYGHRTLLVARKQRKSLPAVLDLDDVKEVPVSAIYLDSNMWGQMKDRKFEYAVPAPLHIQPRFATPIEGYSTPSTPSSRSRRNANPTYVVPVPEPVGMLSNMAFAISYDDSARKTSLANLIHNNGGLLLDDGFHELLQLETLMLKPKYAHLGFTALLADRHSRKEKYMQALALNLPCISGKWVEDCVAQERLIEWQPYLLAAGESLLLDGATKSRILPDTKPEETRLSDILAARPKILHRASVIVVMGKGKTEEKRKPYLFLTQAMGADRIEKVSDAKVAKSLLEDQSFDWVCVDDRDVQTTTAVLQNTKGGPIIAGNDTIVQSLILGRVFLCGD